MPETTNPAPGIFCWFELGTSDAAAAKKFYGELFGWTANDTPAGPDMIYTILSRDGKDVRTRPLCPYPQVAKYNGNGNPDDARSFVCENQEKRP